ncbi:MAG: adenylyl-sulfate kinase [Pseudomonadota bacterium]
MNQESANNNNIYWHNGEVSRELREKLHGHKGILLWFTGLSSSGKSTIAHAVEGLLHKMRCSTYVFDGDNVRHGLCSDLGFSEKDRRENIRRIGEMCHLFIDAGIIAISAFISPYRSDRARIRDLVGSDRFTEIHVDCPVEICAQRDPKGNYKKAMAGIIHNYTGVSAPYEAPETPDLRIESHRVSIDDAAQSVIRLLKERGLALPIAKPPSFRR